MAMVLKTPGEIELMDKANRIVHQVLDAVGERMVPGVKTRELDRLAETPVACRPSCITGVIRRRCASR